MNNATSAFELWPAIDLMEGSPVRLTNGDFAAKNKYDVSLKKIVKQFETFASGIHIIDLDGARSGRVQNSKTIQSLIDSTQIPIQLGGGIRTLEAIEEWLFRGINRVIIGTKALTNPALIQQFTNNFGFDQIVISTDIKQGKVMTNGWTESNEISVFQFIEDEIQKGFQKFIVTDIEQDGTLKGASIELYKELKKRFPNIYLLAAGGVGSIKDLQNLSTTGINGAIFGKAFYEGKISVEELNLLNNAY